MTATKRFLGTFISFVRTYQTFSSADMHRDSISKHLDSFSNLSSNLDTSVISSSTGLPGPLDCNILTIDAIKISYSEFGRNLGTRYLLYIVNVS